MAISHILTTSVKDSSNIVRSCSTTVTGNVENNFDDTVPMGSTNLHKVWKAIQADLQSVALVNGTGADLTIKTNSSGSPQETIVLKAGQVLVWRLAIEGIGKIPFSGDVTDLYLTNAGAADTTLQIRALGNQ